jgi:hypothetical protein
MRLSEAEEDDMAVHAVSPYVLSIVPGDSRKEIHYLVRRLVCGMLLQTSWAVVCVSDVAHYKWHIVSLVQIR